MRQTTRNLVLVLGDQLDERSSALDRFDAGVDAVWMAEVDEEATHVWSHKARIALFLSAMRHFRDALRKRGLRVEYRALDAAGQPSDLGATLRAPHDGHRTDRLGRARHSRRAEDHVERQVRGRRRPSPGHRSKGCVQAPAGFRPLGADSLRQRAERQRATTECGGHGAGRQHSPAIGECRPAGTDRRPCSHAIVRGHGRAHCGRGPSSSWRSGRRQGAERAPPAVETGQLRTSCRADAEYSTSRASAVRPSSA
ncbi:MAG: cryptochrome/photolyase family protein [Acidobacteria bacterium]|nr:cryptochrome/photolyase family protein [Acidobacteriota bacterium]